MNLDPKEIGKIGEIAALLEVSAYPKAGNVHRTQNIKDMTFEDFIISGVSIRESLEQAALMAGKYYQTEPENIQVGKHILESIKSTQKLVKTNTNLGICMLLIPLAAAFGAMTEKNTISDLPRILDNIIRNTTVSDAINLTKAINFSQAGGLEDKNIKYDVNNEDTLYELQKNDITLYKLLDMSSTYDNISYELTHSLPITLNRGWTTFKKYDTKYSQNDVTLEIYLSILSETPDTLINRKYGNTTSENVQKKAKQILEKTKIATNERKNEIKKFDEYLTRNNYNPGTTADFTASTLFVSLVDKFCTK